MKKIIDKKIIVTFIISGIIFGSLGVYAANLYNASDIAYTKNDGSITNVSDALNELYSGCSESLLQSGDIKVDVTRTHIDGSGYADKQTVRVVVTFKNEVIIDESMTDSSAYNQTKSYVSGDIKVDVIRTHINGSGYADKQTVNVVVYYKDKVIIDKSMTNSSAYNQSDSYTNEWSVS